MTTTTNAPVTAPDDIPGVTRRHRLSDLYHERTNFQFIKHSKRWLILSSTLVILSILLVATRGLNYGIEFKGGTSWQVQMQNGKSPKVADVRSLLSAAGLGDAKVDILTPASGAPSVRVQAKVLADPTRTIQQALASYAKLHEADVQFIQNGAGGSFTFTAPKGVTPNADDIKKAVISAGIVKDPNDLTVTIAKNGQDVTVDAKTLPSSTVTDVSNALAKYAGASANDVNINVVGTSWGRDVTNKMIKALIFFFILLATYLAIRFEWKMSVAAIVAVIHDIIFTVGVYALFQFSVTPATVTAFLTILGFSLYDTVVVFDKVSEYQRTLTATGKSTYGEMVNRSLNAVLMRSLSTSLVALLPVLSLLIVGSGVFGATALQDFALALAAGLFIGSYSSIFVAAPLLAWWKEREPQYRALAERRRRTTAAAASASTGAPVVPVDDVFDDGERTTLGVPGPPAVPRAPIQARARQQRGKKRR